MAEPLDLDRAELVIDTIANQANFLAAKAVLNEAKRLRQVEAELRALVAELHDLAADWVHPNDQVAQPVLARSFRVIQGDR